MKNLLAQSGTSSYLFDEAMRIICPDNGEELGAQDLVEKCVERLEGL
jgi:hypothetical protein